MKTMAYYPVHYGKEYFAASIKSIEDQVDRIAVLYTPTPSYGHHTSVQCPESEDEIRSVAEAASPKVEWHRVSSMGNEGQHRGKAFELAKGFDIMLALDTDEVWDPTALEKCIKEAYDGQSWRRNVAGFVHFWRSFDWACYDGFVPARLFNLQRNNKIEETIEGRIYHFGYAQSDRVMNYKFEIHGHKNEIKPGWLQNTYFSWQPGNKNLHPTCDIWGEAQPFDKESMPQCLKEHPNFNKAIIS